MVDNLSLPPLSSFAIIIQMENLQEASKKAFYA